MFFENMGASLAETKKINQIVAAARARCCGGSVAIATRLRRPLPPLARRIRSSGIETTIICNSLIYIFAIYMNIPTAF
jgi:hypothetical protein